MEPIILFTGMCGILSLFYFWAVFFLLRGLRNIGHPGKHDRDLTFSVIIAARNEEHTLDRCLDHVFDQSLPSERFEVIVINDRSTDATAAVCEGYARNHPNISVITITETPQGIAPKKHAVAQGVRKARNEIVVLTDADCTVPRQWLETIGRHFSHNTGLVQGITAYAENQGMNRFFWGVQAIDFLSHGIVSAAAIGAGMPLNSNANNFAFRRTLFEEVAGYGEGSKKVVSGDDDLLLQRIAADKKWEVSYMTDPAGAVTTAPTPTVAGVFEQRKRWGSKTVNYPKRQVAFLFGIFLFYSSIVATVIMGFFEPRFFLVAVAMVGAKIAGEYLLLIPGTALFQQKQLRPYIIPASLLQAPVVIAAVVLGVFGRFSWKGERYRRTVR
jgi:cellulose synthase/poly-beta-1,6-N-acetylglucosamine synthase-like glycosyltransferase